MEDWGGKEGVVPFCAVFTKGRSAVKIRTECLLYNRVESY